MTLSCCKFSKKSLTIIGIIIWIITVTILGYVLGSGQYKRIISNKIGSLNLPQQTEDFSVPPVKIQSETQKTKVIGKNGGKITIVDIKGVKITLKVPPGAVNEDKEITLVAIDQEDNGSNQDNNQNQQNRTFLSGVLIKPLDMKFSFPARLFMDFDPTDDRNGNNQNENLSLEGQELPQETQNPVSVITQPDEIGDEEMTGAERQRRTNASRRETPETAHIHFSDSTESQSGTKAYFTPIYRNPGSNSIIESDVNGGGSISSWAGDTWVDVAMAIEKILNNPNATIGDIIQATSGTQGMGEIDFKFLGIQARNRLEYAVDKVIKEKKQKCKSGKPVSKRSLLALKALTQSVNGKFSDITDEEQTKLKEELWNKMGNEIDKALEECRGYLYYNINYVGPGLSETGGTYTYNFKGSVCGYLDEQWKGSVTEKFVGPLSEEYGRSLENYIFSLPSEGGQTMSSEYPFFSEVYSHFDGATGYSKSTYNLSHALYYDGVENLIIDTDLFKGPIRFIFTKECPSEIPSTSETIAPQKTP